MDEPFTAIPIGTTFVRLLVPSRRIDGGVVDGDLRQGWIEKSAQVFTKYFGGDTPQSVIGAFTHDDGRVTREEILVRSSSVEASLLEDTATKEAVLRFAGELCAGLGQESVFVGWGDVSYVVSKAFSLEDVPVIPFAALQEDAQARHLSMAWGGVNHPAKMLQVLSLDTWSLPGPSEPVHLSELRVVGVLHEGKETRRAWSWAGAPNALAGNLKGWRAHGGPREGDLIVSGAPSRRSDSLAISLVTASGLAGPGELRTSHGRLNPITRQLLRRTLLRDWNGLADDLTRKPLSTIFLGQLRTLKIRIQREVGKPGERDAFRESALIVGRLMFLRFLSEKRDWLPPNALTDAFARYGEGFFEDFLQPLWFEALNVPKAERTTAYQARFAAYPYLNGGLFIPRPRERTNKLPASLFDPNVRGSFLDLFSNYEFSLNEYAGSDESLRVDPSLFGRLLETFNSDREKKQGGVHYTPKSIALALAMEAIIARVTTLTGVDRDKLVRLASGERSLSDGEATHVESTLHALRIIDPAVGSGVLLWACLEVLLLLDSACNGIRSRNSGYQRGSSLWAQRSRHFVCHCLFGVDISDEAVELARLRIWLAVALSQDEPTPLPDLELNICRGDSLLPQSAMEAQKGARSLENNGNATRRVPTSKVAASDKARKRPRAGIQQLGLGLDEHTQLTNDLLKAVLEHERAVGSPVQPPPSELRLLRDEVLRIRQRLAELAGEPSTEDPPFSWELNFPQVFGSGKEDKRKKRGFDVVIANPPYVRIQELHGQGAGGSLVETYRAAWSTLGKGNADLSYAFLELALRKLAAPEGGQIAFIQPSFRQADAAERLRALVLGQDPSAPAHLRLWVDFGDQQVFPTATNYVALLFGERRARSEPQASFHYSLPPETSWREAEGIEWLRPPSGVHEHPATAAEWLTVDPAVRDAVLRGRASGSMRLADLAFVEVGIQTSADDVFLFRQRRDIDSQLVEVRRKEDSPWIRLESALVRSCQKGAASDAYFVLFPYDADGKLLEPDALSRRFPRTWKYLSSHRERLSAREGGAKFADAAWYRFGRTQGVLACQRPKLVIPALLKDKVKILVDTEGALAYTASGKGGGGAWAIRPRDPGLSLAELAQLLQAPEVWTHVRAHGSPQKGGWRGVDKALLEAVPITGSERLMAFAAAAHEAKAPPRGEAPSKKRTPRAKATAPKRAPRAKASSERPTASRRKTTSKSRTRVKPAPRRTSS